MLKNNDMKNEPSRDDLSKIIDDVMAQATSKIQDNRKIEQNLQSTFDRGRVTKPMVDFLDQKEVSNQFQYWNEVNNQLGSITPISGSLFSTTDYMAGTASTSSASVIGFVSQNHQTLSEINGFSDIWEDYNNVVTGTDVIGKIRDILCDFHLDNGPSGELSPLELFNTAIDAYNSPVSDNNPAITSLIPLRESISSTIKTLLKFRPKQEKTGSSDRNKIISIGEQLKKDFTSSDMVDKWAEEWHKINDEYLSDSKESSLSRPEWTARLFRAASFYYGFLSGLDHSKFRKNC